MVLRRGWLSVILLAVATAQALPHLPPPSAAPVRLFAAGDIIRVPLTDALLSRIATELDPAIARARPTPIQGLPIKFATPKIWFSTSCSPAGRAISKMLIPSGGATPASTSNTLKPALTPARSLLDRH